jgi:DNA-binding CsgD family transcriptional regulator
MTSNEYLNAIRSTLVDLLHNADTLNYKSIKAKIKSVQQLIESNYNEQETLFAVEQEIQHVHKDFIEKLSLQYPVLSHTEIRVCLLLRLNLNTHQIAAMMNISPATVFTHRKNIRKKLGLQRTTNLSVLLMQLSGLQVEG